MNSIEQLKVELYEARQKKAFFEEQIQNLGFCINVLKKEVDYRTKF